MSCPIHRTAGAALLLTCFLAPVGPREGAAAAEEKYRLLYNMKKSSRFTLTYFEQHRNQRVLMGKEIVTVRHDTIQYGFNVMSSGKEGLELELEYKRRAHDSDDPRMVTRPDFSNLIGRRATFMISPKGVFSLFQGFGKLPKIEIPDFNSPLGEERYIRELKTMFPRLPGEQVGIGDSWSHVEEYDEPVGEGLVNVTVEYTHTLLEHVRQGGRDCVRIKRESTVRVEGTALSSDVEWTMNLSGAGSEIILFAWKTGMLLSMEGTSVVEGWGANQKMGLSVPMRHQYDTKVIVDLER